jgi:hypothetical protein
MSSTKRDTCRFCGSSDLECFLDLGNHPPSNSFLRREQIHLESRYPLRTFFCKGCFLVQLLDVVSGKEIFDNYDYLSSTSRALVNHYTQMTQYLSSRFDLKEDEVVVDIGCNDGITLNTYEVPNLQKIGIEPSKVVEVARESGLQVINSFFSKEVAEKVVNDFDKAKIITATNVFAHVDNMDAFVEGIPSLLANDGVFVIEVSYLIELIDQTLFDTIYHEHLCYYSLTALVPFLKKHGLEVFDVEKLSFGASGPALRVFMQKEKGAYSVAETVERTLSEEKKWGVGNFEKYQNYAKKVEDVKQKVLLLLQELSHSGFGIGGFGAPAKGNTLLNYFGISTKQVQYIAENNMIKQGKLTPGSHIPIVSDEEFLERMPSYALLLSWNYLDFFLKNSEYISKGGKFIVPLPEPRILP